MATQVTHISLDRVEGIGSIRELVECYLCHGLLWYPVACKNCNTTFCSACIQALHATTAEPICPHGCSTYIERLNPQIIFRLLTNLKIRCQYEPNGCKDILPYNELEKHEEICDYRLLSCNGCQQGIIKKNFDQHRSECPLLLITCDQCLSSYRRKDKDLHTSIECLRQQVKQQNTKIDAMEKKLKENDKHWEEFLTVIHEARGMFEKQVQLRQSPGHNAEFPA